MKTFCTLLVCTLVSACGFTTMPGKLDKTNSGVSNMDNKMDHTNSGLDKANAKIDQTNTGLDKTNASLDKTNASLDKTNASLDQTNANIQATTHEVATTNAAIHNQILLLSMQELTKPENTTVLTPPIGMIPAGQKFAEEATADEVLELMHGWLTEYVFSTVDAASLKKTGYTDSDVTKLKADFNHQLEAKFVGLQIIAGMLPDSTVKKIAEHITSNGRYKSDALTALMLRSYFIDTFLLQLDLLRDKVTLYGQMKEAVSLVKKIDDLGRLPFAADIGFNMKKTGEVKLDAKATLTRLYQDLDQRFDTELDAVYRDPVTPEEKQQAQELTELHQQVKDALTYWQARP